MTSCTFTDQLDAYLDGDLTPEAARAVEVHVAECTACVEELALAERIQGVLQALPEEPCPDDVFTAALARIEREKVEAPTQASALVARVAQDRPPRPASQTNRFRRWRVAGAVVAVLAVVATGIFLIRPGIEIETQADIPLQADVHPSSEESSAVAPVDSSAESTPIPSSTLSDPQPEAPSAGTVPDEQIADAHQEPQRDSREVDASTSLSTGAEAAREEARLALSRVAEAGRRGADAAQENVNDSFQHVSEALAVAYSK